VVLVLAVAVYLIASGSLRARLGHRFANVYVGVEIACPRGWQHKYGGYSLMTVVSSLPADHKRHSRTPADQVSGGQLRIEIVGDEQLRFALPTSPQAELADVCRYLGFRRPDRTRITTTEIMDRPALEISGPRECGWGAAVVARAHGRLIAVHFMTPTRSCFERLRPQWRAMIRSAREIPLRIPGPNPDSDEPLPRP
jgi:hypothetical protein